MAKFALSYWCDLTCYQFGTVVAYWLDYGTVRNLTGDVSTTTLDPLCRFQPISQFILIQFFQQFTGINVIAFYGKASLSLVDSC